MKVFSKILVFQLAFFCLLPFVISAQTVSISGSIVDTATLVGVPNAVVSLLEDASINDTTDAHGHFSLGGTASIRSENTPPKKSIIIRGNILQLDNANQSDATTVKVYNSSGMQIYSALNSSSNGEFTFLDLWHSSGLYFIQVESEHTKKFITCLASETTMRPTILASGKSINWLNKRSATYTLNIAKTGYGTKQTSRVNGVSTSSIIKVQALPVTHPITPMPIISQNVPAYSSANENGSNAMAANDTNQSSAWSANDAIGWLAYDLSSKPLAARHMVLLAWYDRWAGDYFFYNGQNLIKDYKIEINMAAGGGSVPTSGWITVLAVNNNQHNSRQHEINMQGANWIRINVSASHLGSATLDMDIYDVSNGITDFWLLMGDSITFMAMQRNGNNLQNRVHAFKSTAWPGIACAAEGGTSSTTGLQIINDVLASFPGKFITLNYGTNDHPQDGDVSFFNRMDTLCMKIIAAGKTPIIPTMPWPRNSDSASVAMQKINMINQLYAKYPTQLIRGPDLWKLFKTNPALIAPGDVHPGGAGQDSLRAHWVAAMDGLYAH